MGGLTHRMPITTGANFNLANNVILNNCPPFSPGVDDTGVTMNLPYAGTYTIYFSVVVQYASNLTFDNYWVVGYLYDDTAAAYIPGASAYLTSLQNLGPNGDFWPYTGTIVVTYTTATPATIRLLTTRHGFVADVVVTNDHTHYGYTCTY